MKELSIEEKAKAYDSMHEKIAVRFGSKVMKEIFSEYEESEDERIRKEIRVYFATLLYDDNVECPKQESLERWIAWLEMQSEQKSVDKIEPKFKVGDWIVSGDKDVHDDYCVCKITKIDDGRYYIEGGGFLNESSFALYKYRLWTIQDAKDGDILAAEDYPTPFIAIYKERGLNFFNSHCFISCDGEFHEGTTGHAISLIHPATKEQCDLLFQKMHEAGYEWNNEKKELKKIKQNSTAWSEDDEHWRKRAIDFIRHPYLIKAMPTLAEDTINWFKSLKPQWKPSKEQLETFEYYLDADISNKDKEVLIELYNHLKQL